MEQRYQAQFVDFDYAPLFHDNGYNHVQTPVITMIDPKHFTPLYWGLVPSWVKDEAKAKTMRDSTLNAKSETVFELASFRKPIMSKRCLVPATGFFEWMEGMKKVKYPFHIGLQDGSLFSFGGIYDIWQDKETGRTIGTFSIVTTEANPLMARIHNIKKRMPFILKKEEEHLWLEPSATQEDLKTIMKPFPEELLKAHTVSRLITDRNRDSNIEEVLKPFEYPELALLA